MTTTRKAGGKGTPQGEAATPDPRIITTHEAADVTGLPVFKHTQLGPPYVRRSDVEFAHYNPRLMNSGSKKRLREGIKRYGLVERPVYNTLTGHLIGGHQRTGECDRLQGYPKDCPDYLLPINAVSLDDTKEKELNVLLNNPSVQGTYDTAALQALFEDGANPFTAGFESMELQFMFGPDFAAQLEQTFRPGDTDEDVPGDPTASGHGDTDAMQAEADKIKALKERRKVQLATDQGEDSPDHVLHLVYPSARALESDLKAKGFDPLNRYLTAQDYSAAIEAELIGEEA